MNKTITLTIKERNFITSTLSLMAINGEVNADELKVFNYTQKDILKLVNKILNQNYS